MIKQLFLVLSLCFCFYNGYSQIAVPSIPESFSVKTKKAVIIPLNVLNAIDDGKLIAEDKYEGIPNRYGVVQQMVIDIKAEGIKTEIPGRGYVWLFEIRSPNAYSLGITFGKYRLPDGASIFIYNEAHTLLKGAFTSLNNNSRSQLTIADFHGQDAIIEYFEPYHPAFSGELAVSFVSQAYKDLNEVFSSRVGINCSEGDDLQDAKHAVCKMTFHDHVYSYICTGFLVNNVQRDGTPYFQTANHCISSNTVAGTLVVYFNYENSACYSSDASDNQTLSGATLKANSKYSDFSLLLLDEYPPGSYFPYYAGWDASSAGSQKGNCIHHPAGTPKCIAVDNNPIVSYSYELAWGNENGQLIAKSAEDTHWVVRFDQGETEGGSSGAPLFDDNRHVIGQLHGGSDIDDYFGKFSLSYSYNSDKSAQLKYWLDPGNSGILSLDGRYDRIQPSAAFSVPVTQVCPGVAIKLNDQSKYNPTWWDWDIQPSTIEYANGTTRHSQNPEIIFNDPGTYSVRLTVINDFGADNLVKTDYITAGEIQVKFSRKSEDSVVCGCDLVNYPLAASGALNYTFSIERSDKILYSHSQDSLYLTLIPEEKKNGSFSSWIRVVGTQGSCISADSMELKVSVPINDDIEDAIWLWPGRNEARSNFCASVEENEAEPSSVALKNTIWFTFQGPSNGRVSIDTHGFNDRIAVYDADSYADLVSGKKNAFSKLAYNDDRSFTDNTAFVEDLAVEPYKTYWLQVDGTGGATGSCMVDLVSNSLLIYPNPSDGEFIVILSNEAEGDAAIRVVSLTGQVVYTDELVVTKENNRITIDLSPYAAGIYFMKLSMNGSSFETKLSLIK
jgi:PKD repeat protein